MEPPLARIPSVTPAARSRRARPIFSASAAGTIKTKLPALVAWALAAGSAAGAAGADTRPAVGEVA